MLIAATAGVTGAQAASTRLTYTGQLSGVPVISLSAQITLPDATGQADGPYAMQADLATTGQFALLYPYRQSLSVQGQVTGGRAGPAAYRSQANVLQQQEAVNLTYDRAGGGVTIEAVPDSRQAQQARRDGTAIGTVDPLSAAITLIASFAQRQDCSGAVAIFDGVRRYDLHLEKQGYADLPPVTGAWYDGAATECLARPTGESARPQGPIAGLYPTSARLWMAPAVPGMPSVPVRITTTNALGEMVLTLVSAGD